jgi:ParB family chromosome partitioning protein
MSKKALGKGIEALLQGTQNRESVGTQAEVATAFIKPNPDQPRKQFTEESLRELAASIKEKGVLQPILVEQVADQEYAIIAGERRYRAAKIAGLTKIPVIIKSFSETEKLEISLIENIQREDLTPIEEAQAYKHLLELAKITQEELAEHLGKNRSTIANSLRLLKLPQTMQDGLSQGKLSAGHARAILSLEDPSAQVILYNSIIDKFLSVREAEIMAARLELPREETRGDRPPEKTRSIPELDDIKEKFINALGTKISIKGTLQKGKIEISYFSADDLDRIYSLIAGQTQ